ncbi:MAG: NAD-dependent epimerase/dehydratase family protein [Patescibacteria group bacterium]|nr:NAD-dependent epimerase/dehydratase family protein [Patescibacteria group bacterium]MDD3939340.1 NAD-dependent epimerase/dehydratase family protein [Patescibacteria group bacterium]MDD4443979.1 NAD-dependent epimerase/dehydratase family protein [Patescibacteria group bacterium]NCU39456.1 NAD-dependent epimerase/dehydratase family protein [Candidatus Falkowbacteria bacterium]
MKKILVTGGAGFIGSNLVDRLIAQDCEVTVVDDLSSGRRDYINPRAKFWKLNIASEKIDAIFKAESFDFVYHLAAQIDVRASVANPSFDNQINVLGGLNILDKAKKYGVKKVIFASTGGAIYGETEEIPTTEHAPTYPLSPYGINKLAFEKYLNYYYQVYNLNYTILRFANVYGPRQFKGGEAGVIAIFIDNAIKGQASVMYGDGQQTRDFVFVYDVVSALIKAKEIDCRGEINISMGRETSLLELREKIEEVLGEKIIVNLRPAKLGEQRRSCLSRDRAKAVLNWEPKFDLGQGIRETIDWAKAQVK